MPGLSGGNHNWYTVSVLLVAYLQGYKCGTVLFRCAADIPITSAKLSCSAASDDCKAICQYTYKKYVLDENGKPQTRFYTYGCSLGAIILALYLTEAGERKEPTGIDGAVVLSTPWDLNAGKDWFFKGYKGIWAWLVGMNLSQDILKFQLPKMKRYMTQEEY